MFLDRFIRRRKWFIIGSNLFHFNKKSSRIIISEREVNKKIESNSKVELRAPVPFDSMQKDRVPIWPPRLRGPPKPASLLTPQN